MRVDHENIKRISFCSSVAYLLVDNVIYIIVTYFYVNHIIYNNYILLLLYIYILLFI